MTESLVRPAVLGKHAETFATLAIDLHRLPSTSETSDAVVEFALQAIECDYAGIALADAGKVAIGTASHDIVRTIYALQIEHGEGPAITAVTQDEVVHVPDTSAEERWPAWRTAVSEHGIGSVLHVPMHAGRVTLGVLSMFHSPPEPFSTDDIAVAHILARHAAVAVATAQRREDLESRIDARKLVGQAMGILMERYDLTGDQAFEVLRRYSQEYNVKLRDVAQQLIDTRHLPDASH